MIEIIDDGIIGKDICDNSIDEVKCAITNAVTTVFEHFGRSANVCISLVCNDEIREINRTMRDIDKATDVLSFPACDNVEMTDGFLGDIAISLERAQEQAIEYGHSLIREITFLTVHGMLHLFGYDHMITSDEQTMFALQDKILEKIGVTR